MLALPFQTLPNKGTSSYTIDYVLALGIFLGVMFHFGKHRFFKIDVYKIYIYRNDLCFGFKGNNCK